MKPDHSKRQEDFVLEEEIRDTQGLALQLAATDAIQNLAAEELVKLQKVLQHGDTFGWWTTPYDWHPGGAPAVRQCDLKGRLASFLLEDLENDGLADVRFDVLFPNLVDAALLSMVRYLVLCRCGPAGRRPVGAPMKPSNLAHNAYHYIPNMAALSIVKAIRGDEEVPPAPDGVDSACFYRLTEADFLRPGYTVHRTKVLGQELARMRFLASAKLWCDVSPLRATIVSTPGTPHATKTRGQRRLAIPHVDRSPHLPFPDEWVSEMGQKSAWFIEHLGPSLLRCLQGFKRLWKSAALVNLSETRLSDRCSSYLASFDWLDANGDAIEAPPFPILDAPDGKPAVPIAWPPRTFDDVMSLVAALQGADMFVAGMSTAPRTTETITMDRDCIEPSKDGRPYMNGRTYKLVRVVGGLKRDWVLPDFAEQAIKLQADLVALYECLSPVTALVDPDTIKPGRHLWGRVGYHTARSEPLSISGPNDILRSFARMLGMDLNPGGQPIRYHRFRKTLARITALAVTSAPKILMDVFGHKSIEMTLYYILADKDLQADVETVSRELRVLRCNTILGEVVAAELARSAVQKAASESRATAAGHASPGGPAAARAERAVRLAVEEVHMRGEDWGAKDTLDLANRMTMEGRFWEQVRPGVLCTKSADQFGLCTRKRGNPDVSNCQADCDHHLEESWRMSDVDQAIELAVQNHDKELERGQDLVAHLWAGQIRAHVNIFPQVRAKWAEQPTVASILAEEAAE